MNDPRNPYSTNWSTRILEKQFKVGIAVNGFCNGVPVIKLVKKKDNDLPNVLIYKQYKQYIKLDL
jgi:hypothetical protein